MNADKSKSISSMGSQMRRENERLLQEYIAANLEEAKQQIEQADAIFLHAPGLNKTILMSLSKTLAKHCKKVRSLQVQSAKANLTEARELAQQVMEAEITIYQE